VFLAGHEQKVGAVEDLRKAHDANFVRDHVHLFFWAHALRRVKELPVFVLVLLKVDLGQRLDVA
jgi:hypothetical protein